MHSTLIENRQIRVFISSTFQDMHDERDYLMKRTFPKLRILAAERDVTLTELDLRWGITPEESKSGKVVEICFKEIENSIPFFIGIVGSRYGWIPKASDIDSGVKERFPVVKDYLDERLSVTEMEMQFGVLDRPEDMHAFFYLKEQDDNTSIDEPQKLRCLREAIRTNERYPVYTYSNTEELSESIEKAFGSLLDRLFPYGAISETEKIRLGQRSFLNQLCQTYIKDSESFHALDSFLVDSHRQYLIISGPSGLGKSSLLANWIKEKQENGLSPLFYFVGNGGNEGTHEEILSYLINEFSEFYEITEQEEDAAESNLTNRLEKILAVVSHCQRKAVLVIDAINQIVDIDNSKMLCWLPAFPSNVKLIISTTDNDETLDSLLARGYSNYVLSPLSDGQRKTLITSYLASYGKKLMASQIDWIVHDRQCENTLVLKTLLDELVTFGNFERLDDSILRYLGKNSTEEFYQELLLSYETVFSISLVKACFSLILASRSGLSESEILEISGVKPLYWSQFYCSFKNHLTQKNGLIGYSHFNMRAAVKKRYFENDRKWEESCRERIINHFQNEDNKRSWLELTFQYNALGDNPHLHQILLVPKVFLFFSKHYLGDLREYWKKLVSDSSHHYSLDDYKGVFVDEKDSPVFYDSLLDFCTNQIVDLNLAKVYSSLALSSLEGKSGKEYQEQKRNILNRVGLLLFTSGDYKEAFKYHCSAKDINEELNPDGSIEDATYYNNMALTCQDNKKAIDYAGKGLEVLKRINKYYSSTGGYLLANLAFFHGNLNHYDKAIEYVKQSITVREAVNGIHSPEYALSFLVYANILRSKGEYIGASELSQKAIDSFNRLYGPYNYRTASAYQEIGEAETKLGRLDEAWEHLQESLTIYAKIYGRNSYRVAFTLRLLGNVKNAKQDFDEALRLYQDSLAIYRDLGKGNTFHLGVAHECIGTVYCQIEEYEKAQACFEKAVGIFESLYGKGCRENANSFNWLSRICYEQGNIEKAIELCLSSIELRKKWMGENHPTTVSSIAFLASIYSSTGEFDKAILLYKQILEPIKSSFGDNCSDLAHVNGELGSILFEQEKYNDALVYFLKAMDICKNLYGNDNIYTTYAIEHVFSAYDKLENNEKAIEMGEIALSYYEQNGILDIDTAGLISNLGGCYARRGDYKTALQMRKRALSMAKELDKPEYIAAFCNRIANTYASSSDSNNAAKYYKEAASCYKKLGDEEEYKNNLRLAEKYLHGKV